MGLDLRWDSVLRDLQIQLEPRVSRSEALFKAPREEGSWFQAELDCSLMQFNNPTSARDMTIGTSSLRTGAVQRAFAKKYVLPLPSARARERHLAGSIPATSDATVDGTHFRANYKGGTGNDLTLIVVL